MRYFIQEDFKRLLKHHTVDRKSGSSPRPWTFKHEPVIGAIDNHQIQSADGTFVGEIYGYADAKLICAVVNRQKTARHK